MMERTNERRGRGLAERRLSDLERRFDLARGWTVPAAVREEMNFLREFVERGQMEPEKKETL